MAYQLSSPLLFVQMIEQVSMMMVELVFAREQKLGHWLIIVLLKLTHLGLVINPYVVAKFHQASVKFHLQATHRKYLILPVLDWAHLDFVFHLQKNQSPCRSHPQ